MTEPVADRTGPRASFGQRLVAVIIDAVVLWAVSLVVAAILDFAAAQPLSTLLGLAYYIYLEGSPSGQTFGKKVMNIRVIDLSASGGTIGYGRAAIRYFARILSAIPCLVGYFWMLWDDQKQTWHDKLATSVVVPTSAYPVDSWPG